MGNSYTSQNSKVVSHREDLGSVIATYPAQNQTLNRVIGISLGCMLILASIGFFALRFSDMVTGIRAHGRASVLLHAPSLILLLAFLPVGVIILLLTAINWDNQLTLFEDGLVMRRGPRKKIWTWKSTTRLDTRITHIKFGGSIVDIRIKLLVGNAQESLVIRNWYEDMTDLVQKVRTSLLPILVDWAEEKFKQNKPVEFYKKLFGAQEGLKIKGEQFGWDMFDPPKIKNQKLTLYGNPEQKKVFSANLNQITNLDLLIFLLKNARGIDS